MISGSRAATRRLVLWFLAPTLLVLAAVALWPLVRTFAMSFTDARLGSSQPAAFVDLRNYVGSQGLFGDRRFLSAAGTTLLFTAVSVALEIVLGTAVALLLHARFAGRGAVRAAVLIPWAIPTVVSAQMWSWMANDAFGVINDLLLRTGFLHHKVAWLAGNGTAFVVLVAVDVWKTTPFVALLLLAGLGLVPPALHEAAAIDGAGPARRFFSITLPLLRPALLVALVFRTLDAVRVFDVFFVMKRDLHTMATYARLQLIDFQREGYGSAVSVAIFAIIFTLTVLYVRLLREEQA
jgi:trehalose/maltose transport system permease protein